MERSIRSKNGDQFFGMIKQSCKLLRSKLDAWLAYHFLCHGKRFTRAVRSEPDPTGGSGGSLR